jgi:hypothetical protein
MLMGKLQGKSIFFPCMLRVHFTGAQEELRYATITLKKKCNSQSDIRYIYVMCRYTTLYSNNLTFATVKVRTLDVPNFI